MLEEFKIQNMVDGMIDFRRNAFDTSRHTFQAILEENKLCIGFSLLLYNPDDFQPEHERWAIGFYMPIDKAFPEEIHERAMKTMRYLAEGMKAFWTDGEEKKLQ